jgi:SAM-dependent methyltransferase
MSRDHYDNVQGDRYAWMLGEVDPVVDREIAAVRKLGLEDGRGRRAVDLGCGTGVHTRMLLSLGYEVTAVDPDAERLEELAELPVQLVQGELLDVLPVGERVVLVSCMGDTLAHLPPAAVTQILATWRPGRTLLIAFRDLATVRDGDDVSVVVDQDATRIHTCLLRGRTDHVEVTDVFHERRAGDWGVVASTYTKRRLDLHALTRTLGGLGAQVTHQLIRGVHYLLAR